MCAARIAAPLVVSLVTAGLVARALSPQPA